VVAIAGALAAANLPSGAYRLEVTVGRSSGPEAVRTLDFDLAR
jgi:hypothetical protein